MARLTEDVKVYIVQRLACYDGPTRVVARVKEVFGVDISPQQVQVYDPRVGQKPAKKWCELYDQTRAAYLEDTADVAIAQKRWRLEELQDEYHKAKQRGNQVLASQLLEQAAKEAGGAFTNHRVHEVSDPVGVLAKLLGVDPDEIADGA